MTKAELFGKYKEGPEFVETGTHRGDGVAAAIEAGFQKIYTFEITGHSIMASSRFRRELSSGKVEMNVTSSRGDRFKNVIANLSDKAVIWLDAYNDYDRKKQFSREIVSVRKHSLYPHTVIVSRPDLMKCSPEDTLLRMKNRYPEYRFAEEQLDDQSVWCFYTDSV